MPPVRRALIRQMPGPLFGAGPGVQGVGTAVCAAGADPYADTDSRAAEHPTQNKRPPNRTDEVQAEQACSGRHECAILSVDLPERHFAHDGRLEVSTPPLRPRR